MCCVRSLDGTESGGAVIGSLTPFFGDRSRPRAILIGITDSGDVAWRHRPAGVRASSVTSLAVNPDGTIVVAGMLGDPYPFPVDTLPWFLAKYDESGQKLWVRRFGGAGWTNSPDALATSRDGDIYLGGPSLPVGYRPHPLGDDRHSAFVARLSGDGELRWLTRFTGAAVGKPQAHQTSVSDIQIGKAGEIVVAGSVGTWSDVDPQTADIDALIARFASSGEFRWFQTPGDGWSDGAAAAVVDHRNVAWLCGADRGGPRGNLLLRAYSLSGEQLTDMSALRRRAAVSMVHASTGLTMYLAVRSRVSMSVLRLLPG
jgi:hypothetical protein